MCVQSRHRRTIYAHVYTKPRAHATWWYRLVNLRKIYIDIVRHSYLLSSRIIYEPFDNVEVIHKNWLIPTAHVPQNPLFTAYTSAPSNNILNENRKLHFFCTRIYYIWLLIGLICTYSQIYIHFKHKSLNKNHFFHNLYKKPIDIYTKLFFIHIRCVDFFIIIIIIIIAMNKPNIKQYYTLVNAIDAIGRCQASDSYGELYISSQQITASLVQATAAASMIIIIWNETTRIPFCATK